MDLGPEFYAGIRALRAEKLKKEAGEGKPVRTSPW